MPPAQAAPASNISLIIVTYGSAACILRCLQSVYQSSCIQSLKIIVVDNASEDSTVDLIKGRFADVHIIENSSNRGFATACNQGLALAEGQYALLLNPDAFLFEDTVEKLVAYLEANPEVGIVGPQLVDEQGQLPSDSSVAGLLPSFRQALFEYTLLRKLFPQSYWIREYMLSAWDRSSSRPVAMVQGACFMFRTELLAELRGLDEQFFLYFEETDFCARANALGWNTHYAADARCLHIGGHSMPNGSQYTKEFFASFYRYHRKHAGIIRALSLRLILTTSFLAEFCLIRLLSVFFSSREGLAHGLLVARVRLCSHLPFFA